MGACMIRSVSRQAGSVIISLVLYLDTLFQRSLSVVLSAFWRTKDKQSNTGSTVTTMLQSLITNERLC